MRRKRTIVFETQARSTDGMVMVYIPESTFKLSEQGNGEQGNHQVMLDSYWIDQTEVTNSHYAQCVENGSCEPPTSCVWGEPTYGNDDYKTHPVICVTWQMANTYCEWAGARLPTEAEWEYASKGKDDFIYPWGNEFDGNLLNFCDINCDESWAEKSIDDGYKESAPVGNFPDGGSWVGALDMAGNVWEWTWDWCGAYAPDAQIDPRGPENGNCKIIRGGAWASPQAGIRTTYRMIGTTEISPEIRHPNIGFRCVMSTNNE